MNKKIHRSTRIYPQSVYNFSEIVDNLTLIKRKGVDKLWKQSDGQ